MKTPFFGAHAVSRSTNFADCQLINLYCEVEETQQSREVGALYAMPGLTAFATAGSGPIYAMQQFAAGLLYVVSGTSLYSVTSGGSATLIGSLHGTPPYSMVQNGIPGNQLAIFGANNAGDVYTISGGLAAITIPFGAAGDITAIYQDGFGLINQPASPVFFQSNTLDLSTWPGLSFGSATGDPDVVMALAQTLRLIYVIKQYETEVWINAGTSPFAFQRLDGTYIEYGTPSPYSVAKVGNSLCWIGQSAQGAGVVVEVNGTSPKLISTQSMTTELQTYVALNDAIGFGYQYGKHEFYVLSFPAANITWVYDKTSSELLRTPIWSKWLSFNGSTFERHLAQCFTFCFGLPLVGSRTDNTIYKIDSASLTDGPLTRKWLRSWRALPKATQNPTRFSSLTLDMEVGTAPTGSPACSLRWSDDGGRTYSNPVTASVGTLGQTALRVKFNRLGSTRRNNGLDRIFELSSSSAFPARLFGAELE